MKFITNLLIKFCIWRGKVQPITGRGDADIYMMRYILFRSSLFSIYIHQFLRSDRDSYHDHPWNFWTYVVSGGYTEHQPRSQKHEEVYSLGDIEIVRTTEMNRLAHRKANALHWVQLDRNYSYEERNTNAPTTICVIGRRKRAWGFMDKNSGKWMFWKKYLGIPCDGEDLKPSEL